MQTRSSALAATPQPAATVLDIGSLPLQLEDLTCERIKALPKLALQELSVLLAEMDRGRLCHPGHGESVRPRSILGLWRGVRSDYRGDCRNHQE